MAVALRPRGGSSRIDLGYTIATVYATAQCQSLSSRTTQRLELKGKKKKKPRLTTAQRVPPNFIMRVSVSVELCR